MKFNCGPTWSERHLAKHEWHTGVGPEGQAIMRPIDRLKLQMKEVIDVLE